MAEITRVGDITVHRIIEMEYAFMPALEMLPDLTPELLAENRSWMEPTALDKNGWLILCFQSYVLRTPHHVILIDSCVGNDKRRPTRPKWNVKTDNVYMTRLAAAGFSVEDIDFVLCTHLHPDHVGWNTRLENGHWVPTFPKARYVFADRELAYWTKRQKDDPAAHPWITDSVLPVVAANRVDIVKSAHAFNELVTLIPTPGHSIDHYSVQVGKAGADAIIAGDMIHSPLQARYPELGMMSDYDSKQAGESRRELFGRFCDTPTLMCTAHFPSPSIGRVVRRGDAFDFIDAAEV
jgi:glyoxylase-like metal-dependent hydrolase (beta-lactamase superfamily II)